MKKITFLLILSFLVSCGFQADDAKSTIIPATTKPTAERPPNPTPPIPTRGSMSTPTITPTPTAPPVYEPVTIPRDRTLAVGSGHFMVITDDGSLWAWGKNDCGQVGDGTMEYRNTPIKILDHVSRVFAYDDTSMAIQQDGTLWIWGKDYKHLDYSGLGVNNDIPAEIMQNVIQVSVDLGITLFLMSDGSLWGLIEPLSLERIRMNQHAQNPQKPFSLNDIAIVDPNIPVKLMNEGILSVVQGCGIYLIIKEDNTLWGWGGSPSRGIGIGSQTGTIFEPTFIMDNVAYVTIQEEKIIALTYDGDMYCWGSNYASRGIAGSHGDSDVPVKLFTNMAVAPNTCNPGLAITAEGELLAWGSFVSLDIDPQTGWTVSATVDSSIKIMNNTVECVRGPGGALAKSDDGKVWVSDSWFQISSEQVALMVQ